MKIHAYNSIYLSKASRTIGSNLNYLAGKSGLELYIAIPYDELIGLYDTLQEADIQKSYDVLDSHYKTCECKLKTSRKKCELTQETLSPLSGVS